METFGQKIRRLRKEQRVTQSELAEFAGVDFTYISKIENGKGTHMPAESTIRKIAMYLGTDADELILLARKVPQELQDTIVGDKLAVDFLRVFPKLNDTQRGILKEMIKKAEGKP